MTSQKMKQPGDKFFSPGRNYEYQVIGFCCLLYDREQLPYPMCSLQWKGKAPSWNRVGRRFVQDMATKHLAVYAVELLHYKQSQTYFHYNRTTYLDKDLNKWYYQNHKVTLKDAQPLLY
jgi:hypothetical protein